MPIVYKDIANLSVLRAECDEFGYFTHYVNFGRKDVECELLVFNPKLQIRVWVKFGSDISVYVDRREILSKHMRVPDVWEQVKRLLGDVN